VGVSVVQPAASPTIVPKTANKDGFFIVSN